MDKDYGNSILALLVSGYSRAKIKETPEAMNLPYSEETAQDLVDMIYEHLQFYKSDTTDIARCLRYDAYRAKLRDKGGKVREISLYVRDRANQAEA